MGFRTLKDAWLLAIAAFIAIPVLHMPFPIIVLVAAILGILGGRTMPDKFKIGGGHAGAGKTSYGPALIDDDTPTPEHARFSWRKLAAATLIGIGIGVAM